jgi:hypothetical protein
LQNLRGTGSEAIDARRLDSDLGIRSMPEVDMLAVRLAALAVLAPLAGATTWIVDVTGGHGA